MIHAKNFERSPTLKNCEKYDYELQANVINGTQTLRKLHNVQNGCAQYNTTKVDYILMPVNTA